MKISKKLKTIVEKYDHWCESMGLTQEQGRCCVPVRKEDYSRDEKVKTEEEKDNGAV